MVFEYWRMFACDNSRRQENSLGDDALFFWLGCSGALLTD